MLPITGEAFQNFLLGAGTVGLVIWGAYERWSKTKLQNATNEAGTSVALAQEAVFNMLNQRLDTMESEIRTLRTELSVERMRSRKMELHIFKMENVMRAAGLDPPVFEDSIIGS